MDGGASMRSLERTARGAGAAGSAGLPCLTGLPAAVVLFTLAAVLLAVPSGCSGATKKKPKAKAAAKAGADDDAAEVAVAEEGGEQEPAEEMADEPAAEGDDTVAKADADDGDWPLPAGVDPDTPTITDGERIAVFAPKEWARAAQSKDQLVKFTPSRRKTYPSIVVLASDVPGDFEEVDPDDQKKFVAAVAASLAKTYTKNGKSTLLKKPAPIRLGEHLGATWSAPATVKVDGVPESIDRISYAIVIAGRMYTVEVRAPKGKLEENDGVKLAKAVAEALRQPEFIPKSGADAGFAAPPPGVGPEPDAKPAAPAPEPAAKPAGE